MLQVLVYAHHAEGIHFQIRASAQGDSPNGRLAASRFFYFFRLCSFFFVVSANIYLTQTPRPLRAVRLGKNNYIEVYTSTASPFIFYTIPQRAT